MLGGCLVAVFAALVHLVSYVAASGDSGTIVSPRTLLDPINLPLELSKRSPADNTTYGAGLSVVGLSADRQSYYTVIQVGGINFRVVLDTGSADLWLVSSNCSSDFCKKVPSYPLSKYSTTFLPVADNTTLFKAHYADDTSVSGFVAAETVGIANFTHPNQTFGLVTNSNVSLTDQTSGLLGLGFPRLSSFSTKNYSNPFVVNLAVGGWLEYPLFAFSLAMNTSGTISLGAIDSSIVKDPSFITWNQVVEFPPLSAESNQSSYLEWVIPIAAFAVNGTSFTPIPTYVNSSQAGTLALFDIGASGIFGSYQDVTRIFGEIKGSRLVGSGIWAIPCDTTVPISFTFGMKTFYMLPTDYLRGPASGNPNLCVTWIMALPPSSVGVDWQFGTPFLRTVYSIFSFGINEKEPPLIGLYPIRNDTNITDSTESPANINSYLSANPTTIPTTFPNYLLPTPTFTTPPYTFNGSVSAVQGAIVTSGLGNKTYSPIFGTKTSLDNASALPTILPPLTTFIVTESGRLLTMTTIKNSPSVYLGLPATSAAMERTMCVWLIFLWMPVLAWTI